MILYLRIGQITGKENIKMNYKNFRIDIVSALSVSISGWPTEVEFQAPSEIEELHHLKAIFEAWRTGEAFWFKMSSKQVAVHKKSVEDDLHQGKQVTVPRKERKDAGGTHKKPTKRKKDTEPAAREDDEEAEQRPKKKKKHAGKKSVPEIPIAEPGPSKGKGKKSSRDKRLGIDDEQEKGKEAARFNDDDDDDKGPGDDEDIYLGGGDGEFLDIADLLYADDNNESDSDSSD